MFAAGIAMDAPFFHELRKQASFFLKEKIRTARLALTDVTPAQLLTEEATNASSWAPDAKTMRCISRAAFEIDDYWRIVDILHKKFEKFDGKHWREPYKALILVEYLLTHGPESIAEEFQGDKQVIQELGNLKYIDERGFNWGSTVRDKTHRVLKLLEKGPHLKEERDRARKISRGIQGFGSFNLSWSSTPAHEFVSKSHPRRSNSHHKDYNRQNDVVDDCEKENLKCDAGLDQQIRRSARAEAKPLHENSGNKIVVIEETTSTVSKKLLLPEESKPLLAFR